jgi:hypothetical protein
MTCEAWHRLPRVFYSLSLTGFFSNSGSLAIFAAIRRASVI